MQYYFREIDPEDEKTIKTPYLKASKPCGCGCSPQPFVMISDGECFMSAMFDSEEELNEFKESVSILEYNYWEDKL